MSPRTRTRLFGYDHAFDQPATLWITAGLIGILIVFPLVVWLLARKGRISTSLAIELRKRYLTWLALVPLMLVPLLLGAAWTMGAIFLLSMLCFSEYARITGLFRERTISLVVVLGIIAVNFAVVDHWYGFFVALFPLTVGAIAAAAILADRPEGYIQRVALGVLGFALFGSAFGHLGYMANDTNFRPILLLVVVAVEGNDIFAYVSGKTLGRHKLAPNTSPNKTVAGALGAVVLTTLLVVVLGHFVFADSILDHPISLVMLGVIISVVGQLGDLMLSSIKRDLGIKDTGSVLPGHGGMLDRFDSLILVAPAVFHYVGYFIGFGIDQQTGVFSGN